MLSVVIKNLPKFIRCIVKVTPIQEQEYHQNKTAMKSIFSNLLDCRLNTDLFLLS